MLAWKFCLLKLLYKVGNTFPREKRMSGNNHEIRLVLRDILHSENR